MTMLMAPSVTTTITCHAFKPFSWSFRLHPVSAGMEHNGDEEEVDEEEEDSFVPSLLQLPAEIRNRIWAFLLEDHHIHIRSKGDDLYHHVLRHDQFPLMSNEILHRCGPSSLYGKLTPVWLVNRTLYHETRHIPFSPTNIFSFEDEGVIQAFLSQASTHQLAGIKNLWLVGDQQSANAMAFFAPSSKSKDSRDKKAMTVYIPSRCNKLEHRANFTGTGAMQITERLRAGWELASERTQVEGLKEIWEELVENVVVVELDADIRTNGSSNRRGLSSMADLQARSASNRLC